MKLTPALARLPFLNWLPWLSLLVGLGITYAVWHDSRSDNRQTQRDRFDFYVAEIVGDIEARMRIYEQALNGTAGLFLASESVARDEFRTYVESLNLTKNYPGIQGVGFSLLVPAREKARHIERIRKDGFPDYSLRPEGERDFYSAIVYIEPFEWRNRRAFGYDMYSNPVRREAMLRAWESGTGAISGKVTLLQETHADRQSGFLMYVPVYRHHLPHKTLQERRANLLGWAYAPFRMDDLMSGVLHRHFSEKQISLDIEIFDGAEASLENLLYQSDTAKPLSASAEAHHTATRQIRTGGRTWTLVVKSLSGFGSPAKLRNIALTGIIGSLMLAMLLWLLVHRRREALKLAERMNRDLIASERHQKALLAHLPAAVVVHRTDTSIRYCNKEATQLLGISDTEALGRFAASPLWGFLSEDGSTMDKERYPVNLVLTSKAPLYGYVVGIPQRGEQGPRWVQVNAFPNLDDAGQITEIIVTFLDITARRAVEQAFREAIRELDDLYDHAPCGYHSLDGEGRFVRINQTELDWLGYGRDELIGRPFSDLFAGNSWAVFEGNYPRFKAVGHVEDLEYELRRKDGSTFTALLSATAIYDAEGRFVMTRSTLHDITARKQSERELQRLNHLYALLSRANQAIIRTHDLDRLLEEICRIAVEEGGFVMAWTGRLVEGQVIPYAHWGREEGYLEQAQIVVTDRALGAGPTGMAIREGRHFVCDDIASDPRMEPWRALALERGYHSSAAFPVSVNGTVVGALNLYAPASGYFSDTMIELLDDLTEDVSFAMNAHAEADRRRQAESDLHKLNEQLEQRVRDRTRALEAINKELESFSYSVSHDLRAPLRSIDGFSQVLMKRYADKLDDTGRDYLGRVRRATQRMGDLIDDLLQLSRVTRGELRRQEIDLTAMAKGWFEEMRRATPDRRVKVTVHEGMHAFGDLGLLRVMLDNLLGNAWKFTRHTEAAEIEFGCLKRDDELVYFVRDNGAGFDNAYAGKLFQVFQRLHSEAEFEGTGIGLATVQRIVQRHHGTAWAEGASGKGATFWFILPQRLESRNDEGKASE